MSLLQAPYLFVVDTDSYSGNFERELVGYITGVDSGLGGEEEAEQFREAFPEEANDFKSIVMSLISDNRDYPSVSHIYPTPGRFNHGLGVHFDDGDDLDVVRESYIKKTDEYYIPQLKKAEEAVEKGHLQWQKDVELYRNTMQEARTCQIIKFPAYESVAVAFSQKPSDDQITLMKNRAQEFSVKTNRFKIRGFRLIEHTKIIHAV